MVALTRAWYVLSTKGREVAPNVTRLLVVLMILYPAFRLHERVAEVERREQSLAQKLEAVSRRERTNDDRERDLKALAVRLESTSQSVKAKPARALPMLVDDGVVRAGYRGFASPIGASRESD